VSEFLSIIVSHFSQSLQYAAKHGTGSLHWVGSGTLKQAGTSQHTNWKQNWRKKVTSEALRSKDANYTPHERAGVVVSGARGGGGGRGRYRRHRIVDSSRMPQMCRIPLRGIILRRDILSASDQHCSVGAFSLHTAVQKCVHIRAPEVYKAYEYSCIIHRQTQWKRHTVPDTGWILYSFVVPEWVTLCVSQVIQIGKNRNRNANRT